MHSKRKDRTISATVIYTSNIYTKTCSTKQGEKCHFSIFMIILCNGSFIAIYNSVELNGKHKIKITTSNEKELNGKHKKGKYKIKHAPPKP